MAREVLRTSFNLEQPKHVLDKPVVVDEVPFWLENESEGESWSTTRTWGESAGFGSSSGSSQGSGETFDRFGNPLGFSGSTGLTSGTSESWGMSSSESRSDGGSRASGRAQTLKSVRVTLPTAVHSLDEAIHLAVVKLRELPNRAAIVRRRGKPPVRIRTPEIKPALASDAGVDRFLGRARAASPYLREAAEADGEIARRMATISGREPASDGDCAFWTEAS